MRGNVVAAGRLSEVGERLGVHLNDADGGVIRWRPARQDTSPRHGGVIMCKASKLG